MRALLAVCLAAACGGSSEPAPDAPDFTQLRTLIASEWSLAPGSEAYQCATVTVPRDMYITELRPMIPVGTHHTVMSIGVPLAPDHPGRPCADPFEFGGRLVYGTGVGSKPFVYPAGVALKLAAGQQVHVNLHLFNTGDTVLTGTSGIEVREADPATVQHLARMLLTGKDSLTIHPGVSTLSATCHAISEVNIVSFQPHMHQLGTHMTYTVTPTTGAPYALYDQDYAFEGQEHVMFEPARTLKPGDQLTIDCTYNNTTGRIVTFGESSNDEMCFAGMTIYPDHVSFCQ